MWSAPACGVPVASRILRTSAGFAGLPFFASSALESAAAAPATIEKIAEAGGRDALAPNPGGPHACRRWKTTSATLRATCTLPRFPHRQ
jgi:poly(3-hydroxybutyrate) depolymerase